MGLCLVLALAGSLAYFMRITAVVLTSHHTILDRIMGLGVKHLH